MTEVIQCFDVDDFDDEIWWTWMRRYDVMPLSDVIMTCYDGNYGCTWIDAMNSYNHKPMLWWWYAMNWCTP